MNKKRPSLKVNMVLNGIKGVMAVIFPLITFPYATRVLGVDNVGSYSFAESIVSYFLLLAALGIETYAVREGARIREDKEKIGHFADQMFTINVLSAICSIILLIVALVSVRKLQDYRLLIIILGTQIIFKPMVAEWVFTIFEDYLFITIRSIVFQVISLVLLFACVHTKEDLVKYTWIASISVIGAGIANFIYSRKYVKLKLCRNLELDRHLKPIMTIFATAVTIVIYTSSDTTILGFMCDDYTVGIYSVSVKVYNIVKTLLSSVLVVSIPRLSALYGDKNFEEFKSTAEDIYSILLSILLPAIFGIIILRKEIVYICAGQEFMQATSSLTILCIALFFCLAAWFWGQCILIPLKYEKQLFNVTMVSAIVNVVLNLIFIPFFAENAAAFTTVVAEAISYLACMILSRKQVKLESFVGVGSKVAVGCLVIFIYSLVIERLELSMIMNVLVIVGGSIILYFITEIILKNSAINGLLKVIKK